VGCANFVWVQKIDDPWLMSLALRNGVRSINVDKRVKPPEDDITTGRKKECSCVNVERGFTMNCWF
jgi:hypothetical protein